MSNRSRRSRLQVVPGSDAGTEQDTTPPTQAAEPVDPGDPVEQAARAVTTAQARLADARGVAAVAAARLEEAVEAAPKVHPVLAAAREQLRLDQAAAGDTAAKVAHAQRSLQDCEGAVLEANARLEDAETDPNTSKGSLVAAQVRAAKAARAEAGAHEALIAAQQDAEHADATVGASEQRVQAALERPVGEHSSVIAAREKLATAQRAVDAATQALETETAHHAAQVAARDSGEGAGAPVHPVFASVDTFVERYVIPNYCHELSRNTAWCAQWWRHAEAVARLEALWEAFEAMRREPAPSLSTWIRDHFDHHMRALTATDGVFAQCSTNPADGLIHTPDREWPIARAPQEQFHRDRAARVQPLRDEEVTA
ncbi:DUF4913 domain-containing protein [Calidifontibacter terrae]